MLYAMIETYQIDYAVENWNKEYGGSEGMKYWNEKIKIFRKKMSDILTLCSGQVISDTPARCTLCRWRVYSELKNEWRLTLCCGQVNSDTPARCTLCRWRVYSELKNEWRLSLCTVGVWKKITTMHIMHSRSVIYI